MFNSAIEAALDTEQRKLSDLLVLAPVIGTAAVREQERIVHGLKQLKERGSGAGNAVKSGRTSGTG